MPSNKYEFPSHLKFRLTATFDTPKTESINIVTIEHGERIIKEVKPEDLPVYVGAEFQWSDSIMVDHNIAEQRRSTVKFIPHVRTLSQNGFQQYLNAISVNQKKLALTKHNDVVGYGVVTTQELGYSQPIGIYTGLYYQKTIDVIEIPESSDFDAIDSTSLKSNSLLVFRGPDIYTVNRVLIKVSKLELSLDDIAALRSGLQPESTLKTHPLDILKTLPDLPAYEDRYGIDAADDGVVSGRDFRNLMPFLAHAMPLYNPYYWPSSEPALYHFVPTDAQTDVNEWRQGIAQGNLEPKHFLYNGFPILIYHTTRPVADNEILAFNYGIDYWKHGLMTPPVLMYKDGSIVPKSTYKYLGEKHFRFFNGHLAVNNRDDHTSEEAPQISAS